MIPTETIIQQVMLWILTGALGALAGWAHGAVKRTRGEDEAMKQGIRSLLRGEIVRMHHDGMREGGASTSDKDVMQRTYDSYHVLGGNGVATRYFDEFMALPAKED